MYKEYKKAWKYPFEGMGYQRMKFKYQELMM